MLKFLGYCETWKRTSNKGNAVGKANIQVENMCCGGIFDLMKQFMEQMLLHFEIHACGGEEFEGNILGCNADNAKCQINCG